MFGKKKTVRDQAKVNPKTVTEFSEGKVKRPKRKQQPAAGGKSGKVESFKPDPRVVAEVKKIKKRNPDAKVTWNKDGSANIKNK